MQKVQPANSSNLLPTMKSEEIALDWTKEALTFKWYEEPEDWDRLCPADEDTDKTTWRIDTKSFI
jgi:hypothetical protein